MGPLELSSLVGTSGLEVAVFKKQRQNSKPYYKVQKCSKDIQCSEQM